MVPLPRPRYLSPNCYRCGSHLSPEHATDPACITWLCSVLCTERVYRDVGFEVRDRWREPRVETMRAEPFEEDGLVIVNAVDDDDGE
jgi:hypothetical protein